MDWLQVIWDWIRADPIVRIPVIAAGVAILAAALAAIAWFFGFFRWLIGLLRKPPTTDAESIARLLAEQARKFGAAEQREQDYQSTIEDQESTIRELTAMIESLEQQQRQPDAPAGIADALAQLEQGETATAESIFQEILDAKKAEGRDANREAAAVARHLGALYFLHDTQKAVSAYEEAVALDPDDPDGWNGLGRVRYRLGQLDAAVEALERVQRLGNAVEDISVISMALGNLGLIYRTRGDLEKAEEYHLKSLEIEKELGLKEGMASDYGNLGLIYRRQGDLEKAEEHHLKSLEIAKELGRKEGMANQYGNLGTVYGTLGDLEKAEEYLLKSLALNEELGRTEGMANQYGNLGVIYHQDRGDLEKAEEYHLKSLDIEKELGRKEGMASDYSNLGQLAHDQGDKGKACGHWAKARRLFAEVGNPDNVARVEESMTEAGCPVEKDAGTENLCG